MNDGTYTLVVSDKGSRTCDQVFDLLIRPIIKEDEQLASTIERDEACTYVIRPDRAHDPQKSDKKTG